MSNSFCIVFPQSCQHNCKSLEESEGGGGKNNNGSASLESTTLVPNATPNAMFTTGVVAQGKIFITTPFPSSQSASSVPKTLHDGMLVIQERFRSQGISERFHRISFSTLKPKVSQVLSFLANLYDSGIGYSATCINTARSALSSGVELVDSNLPLGQQPLINRFLKGVFQSRPSLHRYKNIWSVALK